MLDPDAKHEEDAGLRQEAEQAASLTPEERVAVFCSIMRMVGRIWESLPPEEQLRRLKIGEELEPRPQPWWSSVRAEARP